MYDVLDKLNDPAIRAQHGLPDNIASEIGLEPIRKRYDKLMIEAGTVGKGAGQPDDFDERLLAMGRELGEALDRLESKYPGMATKLDTKLAAEKAASVQRGVCWTADAPDMPARVDSGRVGSDAPRKIDRSSAPSMKARSSIRSIARRCPSSRRQGRSALRQARCARRLLLAGRVCRRGPRKP